MAFLFVTKNGACESRLPITGSDPHLTRNEPHSTIRTKFANISDYEALPPPQLLFHREDTIEEEGQSFPFFLERLSMIFPGGSKPTI